MSLEELEKKLYGIKPMEEEPKQAMKQPVEQPSVKTNWEDLGTTQLPQSATEVAVGKVGIFAKIGFWIMLALVFVGGGAAYYFVSQYYKTKDLAFEVTGVDRVMIARPFDITVHIENRSQTVLRTGKIAIQLPDGAIGIGNESDKQTIEEEVGDLAAGDTLDKTYKIVIVKDEQSTKKFPVDFSYLPQNINTRFERIRTIEVSVDQPAISLNFTSPQKIFNRETFSMDMQYRNVSDASFNNVKIKLIAPAAYAFKGSNATTSAGAIWDIGTLAPQTEQTITASGTLEGPEQSFFDMKAQVVASFNGQEYVINEKTANLGIASSPLSLSIVANGSAQYVSKPGDVVGYVLHYKNNTDVALNDVMVTAQLKGEMFDVSTFKSDGFFDSVKNTATWSAASAPALKVLSPGAEGDVSFSIGTKTAYPIKRMFDKNFTLKVGGEINSPTVPYSVASDRTVGYAKVETKIQGNSTIEAALTQIKGAASPKVGKSSTYRITLMVKNYANDISNAQVVGGLQPGVKWLGGVKNTTGTSTMAYNDRTGEIDWNIGTMVATKGVISAPAEVSFLVEVVPSVTQMGQPITLSGDMKLSAMDNFTGLPITAIAPSLKTDQSVIR